MRILRYLLLFLVQLVITFVCVFFVIVFIENYVGIATTTTPMDSVSLANTFMVFVTFILVGVTLVITLASIWFAKKVSEEKIAIIRDNTKEIIDSIVQDSDLKKHLISSITNNNSFRKEMNNFLTEYTSSQNQDMKRIFETYQNELKEQMEELLRSSNTAEKEQKDVIKINDIIKRINSDSILQEQKKDNLKKAVEKMCNTINKWRDK
ncbi:hypothetical protein ACOTWK_05910 [Aliarcobacter butzleri]